VVACLCSARASFVTGQFICVDVGSVEALYRTAANGKDQSMASPATSPSVDPPSTQSVCPVV
jgi:hypothetical protein